jgi:hypothetical protein
VLGRKLRRNDALAGGFPAAASVLRSIALMDNSLTRRALLRFVWIFVVALTFGAGQALAESGSGSSGSGSSGSNSGSGSGGSGSGSGSDNSGSGSSGSGGGSDNSGSGSSGSGSGSDSGPGSDNSGPGSDNSGPGGGDGGDNSGPGVGDDNGDAADDGDDHERARDAVRDGRALPLGAFIAKIERQYGGRLIDARLRERRGRLVYELKLMSDEGGRVFTVSVDAKTGRPRGLFGS